MRRVSAPWVSRLLYAALRLFAGLLFVLSALMLAFVLPVAYLLFTGQAQAGDHLPLEGVVPSVGEAAVALLLFSALAVVGWVLDGWVAKRQRRER
jgi:hypothetical protein